MLLDNNVNIDNIGRTCSTGYRIFFVLNILMNAPKTIDEIVDIVNNSSSIPKKISKDTIKFDISTLQKSGCKIKKNSVNKKFYLISHPFNLSIKKYELSALLELKDIFASDISISDVFLLNNLLEKIAALTKNSNLIEIINKNKLFQDIDFNILKELSKTQIIGKKVQIRYKSPKYGDEDVDVIPCGLLYENKKIYLWAYNFKYNHKSLFEMSKIIKVNSVSIDYIQYHAETFNVIYEVFNETYNTFEPKSYEKILKKTDNKIIIEANVASEFMFTQRLLLLGRNFKILSPESFKNNLIEKIKLIQKRYKHE